MTATDARIAAGRRRVSRRWASLGAGWGFAAVLLLVWEVVGRADATMLLPPVSAVAAELIDLLGGRPLTHDILPSLVRVVAGFVLGSVAGVVFGVVLGWWRWLAPWCQAALEFLRAVPPPALLPLAIVAFGTTDATRVGVIAVGAFWPVLLNTTDGVRRVDVGYIDTARVFGGGGHIGVLRRVVLPAAAPQIMAGLRTGLAFSLILMVISEMIGSSSGLGHLILQAQRLYALDRMYAGVLLLGALGWLLTLLFSAVERRALAWFYGMRGHQ